MTVNSLTLVTGLILTNMAQATISFPFTKGIDRSQAPHRSDLGSFYDLLNFRYSTVRKGELEQTPYFTQYVQYSQGTYYSGGSQTESTSSAIRFADTNITMTDAVFRTTATSGSVQIQSFYQTTYPAAENVNTGCLLVINDVAALGITLGSTVDIVIDGATTFKWRKNGGAYTTLVPITTAGVSIDGGNATVYFLTTTGFTPGDAWSWTRTDYTYNSGQSMTRPAEYTYYKTKLYITDISGRIMCVYQAGGTPTYVAVSVGYRPVWGSFLAFFDDHLVLGGFSKTAVNFEASPRCKTIGWSDVSDINNFIPTDTNEADSYTLPNNVPFDIPVSTTTTSYAYIRGLAVIQQQLFVFTSQEVYVTSSLGLPVVFSFQKFADFYSSPGTGLYTSCIVRGNNKIYVIASGDIFEFNGSVFRSVGFPVQDYFPDTVFTFPTTYTMIGCYDAQKNELILAYKSKFFCYQEKIDCWYTRNASFASDATFVGTTLLGYLTAGSASRKILTEDTSFTQQPVYDSGHGAAYTTPKITTQLVGGDSRAVKEISSTYILARVDAGSATYYSTSANAQIQLHWYKSTTGLITGTPTTNANAVWVSTNADGLISYPRTDFRQLALEVQLNGLTAAKPPGRVIVCSIDPLIKVGDDRTPSR